MVRLSAAPQPSSGYRNRPNQLRPFDPIAIVSRLISRLEEDVLRADIDRERRLRRHEYERVKILTNVDEARILLAELEPELSRRPGGKADVEKKKVVLEHIVDRVGDLAREHSKHEEHIGDDDYEDEEDLLADIIIAPSSPTPDTTRPSSPTPRRSNSTLTTSSPNPQQTAPPPPPTTTTTSLRNRRHRRSPHQPPSTPPPAPTDPTDPHTEALLSHQRAEQEAISAAILQMAQDMKASSQAFATSLAQDRDVLDRAAQGLTGSERAMDRAAARIGALRRMSEGRGWWGRMVLYAWIWGLMGVLVVLVFGGPKLRF